MARLARSAILYDGCFAHVFSRSMEGRHIFQDDEDFDWFYQLLLGVKQTFDFRIFHYCLMNTHFHLAVGIKKLSYFSRGLQRLKWDYTYWFNKKYVRRGPLWKERFKSLVIEDERYLNACGIYIEQNPVKASMVKSPEKWRYSSSRYYHLGQSDDLVDDYNLPVISSDIKITDDALFMKGLGIGSELFRFCIRKGMSSMSPKK